MHTLACLPTEKTRQKVVGKFIEIYECSYFKLLFFVGILGKFEICSAMTSVLHLCIINFFCDFGNFWFFNSKHFPCFEKPKWLLYNSSKQKIVPSTWSFKVQFLNSYICTFSNVLCSFFLFFITGFHRMLTLRNCSPIITRGLELIKQSKSASCVVVSLIHKLEEALILCDKYLDYQTHLLVAVMYRC